MDLTKQQILDRNGFDFDAFQFENEHSAKNLLIAMDEYAEQKSKDYSPWNPASKPPNENKDVIAVLKDGTFFMARYSGVSGWGFYFLDNGLQFGDSAAKRVTHWMPLSAFPHTPA